jgi:hypothetical protein
VLCCCLLLLLSCFSCYLLQKAFIIIYNILLLLFPPYYIEINTILVQLRYTVHRLHTFIRLDVVGCTGRLVDYLRFTKPRRWRTPIRIELEINDRRRKNDAPAAEEKETRLVSNEREEHYQHRNLSQPAKRSIFSTMRHRREAQPTRRTRSETSIDKKSQHSESEENCKEQMARNKQSPRMRRRKRGSQRQPEREAWVKQPVRTIQQDSFNGHYRKATQINEFRITIY